ncbi:MAG: esterase family protein [Candidatus Dormibacteraceae bacterium]
MTDLKRIEHWHSDRMQRGITLIRWGRYGTPVLVFPTAGGGAGEIEDRHLVGHLWPMIEAGRIKVYSCDSVAGRAMTQKEGSPPFRGWLFNQFQQAIAEEVVPAIHADCGGPQESIVAGASIGAFNALAVLCRYPQHFRAAIGMSGTYDVEGFVGSGSEDLYFSSPLQFLPGLEGPQLDLLRRRYAVLASGSGDWENVGQSWQAAAVLGQRGIPNRVDDWGPGYEHDWPTWWAMLPKYLDELA